MSAWLINCPLACGVMPESIASKTRLSRHGHVYLSIVCRDYTKPEPTMSHGRVFHLQIVQKQANLKTQTSKFTTYTHIYVTACR